MAECPECQGKGTVSVPYTHPTNPNLDTWSVSVCPVCKGRPNNVTNDPAKIQTFRIVADLARADYAIVKDVAPSTAFDYSDGLRHVCRCGRPYRSEPKEWCSDMTLHHHDG